MIRRIRILAVTALCMLFVLLLSACGGGDNTETTQETESADAVYTVNVKDALGNAYKSGIVVKFMQNGAQAAMQVVNEQGVAQKVLPKGEYTVELMYTDNDASYYYDTTDITLTAEKTTLDITLNYQTGESTNTLFAPGITGDKKDYPAYSVTAGSTYVKLKAGDRNFFLFAPAVAGTYEFSVIGGTTAIGYYGAPHFVQGMHVGDHAVENNKFSISVSASMIGTNGTGTTVLVIGIDALENTAECILAIERIGDPEHTLADEPWQIYQATTVPAPYKLPAGASLVEFDLTAATETYGLVYNEADGFYHLNAKDGPLVLVRLGEDSKYLASFKTILDNSGVTKYFFDENGEFVRKESYSECLLQYIANMDADNGLYPLTKDLEYIIKQRGEYVGWFDSTQSLYLFKDSAGNPVPGINAEISWLFMCCYIAE